MDEPLKTNLNNKRKVGNKGESKAVDYLLSIGYQILERNFYSRYGEIDIIAKDNNSIVFVEVKLRNNDKYGKGLESISKRKISSILKTAQLYLKNDDIECRFDVISIDSDKIEHIISAFDAY